MCMGAALNGVGSSRIRTYEIAFNATQLSHWSFKVSSSCLLYDHSQIVLKLISVCQVDGSFVFLCALPDGTAPSAPHA
jgi:hypothetical protein